MQGALDMGGTRSHFNVVPAMPLMEVFLAKDSDVHRSEGRKCQDHLVQKKCYPP